MGALVTTYIPVRAFHEGQRAVKDRYPCDPFTWNLAVVPNFPTRQTEIRDVLCRTVWDADMSTPWKRNSVIGTRELAVRTRSELSLGHTHL